MRRGGSAQRFATPEQHPSLLVVKNALHFIVSHGGQLTISQLLPLILQHPQLSYLDIGNLLQILQSYSNVFDLVDTRKGKPQIQVGLAFELEICEQPRKCGGYPRCTELHICKYFIQNKCRANPAKCSFGHDLHSQHNLQILEKFSLDQIDPEVIKKWMQQHHNKRSRASRPPQVCTFYNTAGGCSKKDSCPFLHLCSYFVKGSCKFGNKCTRSHALRSKRNNEIFREHGIDLRCNQEEILDILSERRAQVDYERWSSVSTDPRDSDTDDVFSNSDKEDEDGMTPGKPFLIKANSDCITIQWKHVSHLSAEFEYQIQYKEMPDGRWNIFTQTISHDASRAAVSGLKASSSYSFRVRLVDAREGEEYPFSRESSIFDTPESPALKMQRCSILVTSGNPEIYRLPTKNVTSARNDKIKSKKLSIGSGRLCVSEKTIMLVGATGSGKSTLIDGLANYLFEVNWEDNFRFTLVSLEHEEKRRLKDQAVSQTEWITCYSIYPDAATKLDYALHIVDTPGFGDTRGVQRDQEIINQIREMFLLPGDKGMACLDAVCFLVKAPDARLTASQKYILEAILSLFGRDMENNICTCITFAEAQEPPVLASLAKTRLPHKTFFKFNNSALFAENKDRDGLAHAFWDIGKKSFDNFFACLDRMETKSLQMTNEVLKTRQDLENTVHNLQSLINAGMSKIAVLEEEMSIFEKHEAEIRENKDFVYEVTEQVQDKEDISGKGQHTTNCLTCNYTCHEKCQIPEDSRKDHCVAMDQDGTCKQCPGKCHWRAHHNTPYIIRWVSKTVKKTYREKLQRYASAQEKVGTQKQVLQKMRKNVKALENGIAHLLDTISVSNNKLNKIALKENPLNTAEYIELMVEAEKRERKSGFMSRIKVLEDCRQKALIGREAADFLQKARQTRSASSKHLDDTGSVIGSESSVVSRMYSLMNLV
ncbi:uncharacterized protein LOC134255803 [Saccostrea cucullata]|uniref:uncharacterized protein LOC134255803 n=1 Tax=Saccostrea cuccullata TaxID=36930 RepID=UPI002ED4692A